MDKNINVLGKNQSESKESRYKDLTVYEDESGVRFYEVIDTPTIIESADDTLYAVEVACENRLDLIANKFYNNPRLMWVIAIANNMENPFNIPIGKIIRIPSIVNLYGSQGVLV